MADPEQELRKIAKRLCYGCRDGLYKVDEHTHAKRIVLADRAELAKIRAQCGEENKP